MNRLLMFLTVAACLLTALAAPARAAPYWVAYEGNDFPENEGWWRVYSGGGADRWIEDGTLVLDGSANVAINDVYGFNQFPLDPEPGELFMAEWRFGIDEVIGHPDPALAIFSDQSWAVGFTFAEAYFESGFEDRTIPFEFSGLHHFRLTSTDMRTYVLFADGSPIMTGSFVHVASASQVRWGDGVQGAASITRWDFVRFGVVPEPCSLLMLLSLCCAYHAPFRR